MLLNLVSPACAKSPDLTPWFFTSRGLQAAGPKSIRGILKQSLYLLFKLPISCLISLLDNLDIFKNYGVINV